jgi:BlaI family penicillinase repressor
MSRGRETGSSGRRGAVLSDLQLEVMRVLWRQGEATVQEVQEALRPGRKLAPTTVATTLSRLEERGAVAHRRDGRQFVYRPLLEEGTVRRSMVRQLTERLFQGDAAALVNHLLTHREIDREDLERIRALLDERARRQGGKDAD